VVFEEYWHLGLLFRLHVFQQNHSMSVIEIASVHELVFSEPVQSFGDRFQRPWDSSATRKTWLLAMPELGVIFGGSFQC